MLTVKEVAKRLQISLSSAYQLIEKGKIVCHRIGMGRGTIRISEEDLTTFLANCREVSVQSPPKLLGEQSLRHITL